MHLPADLITSLGFLSDCYDPTCTDDDVRGEVVWPYQQPLKKIIDFSGRHAGYGAAINKMLDQVKLAGGDVRLGEELVEVSRDATTGGWSLRFTSGLVVSSAAVVLNLPRPALKGISGLPQLLGPRWPALNCSARQFPAQVTEGKTTVKVYAVYEDAWWASKLGLIRGTRENLTSPPVALRYHDGEVRCHAGTDPSGADIWMSAREAAAAGLLGSVRCRGVLEVFYRHSQLCPSASPGCMDWWSALPRRSPADPLTVLAAEGSREFASVASMLDTVSAGSLLRTVHEKLMHMHAPDFEAKNVTPGVVAGINAPVALAYSVWAHEGTLPPGDRGLQAGAYDVVFEGESLPASCAAASPRDYASMTQGVGRWSAAGDGLHVVNNDFHMTRSEAFHGPWAEMSLVAAEQVAASAFGLPRPAWLNAAYYDAKILAGRAGGALWV